MTHGLPLCLTILLGGLDPELWSSPGMAAVITFRCPPSHPPPPCTTVSLPSVAVPLLAFHCLSPLSTRSCWRLGFSWETKLWRKAVDCHQVVYTAARVWGESELDTDSLRPP